MFQWRVAKARRIALRRVLLPLGLRYPARGRLAPDLDLDNAVPLLVLLQLSTGKKGNPKGDRRG